jgi:hypothetical protein
MKWEVQILGHDVNLLTAIPAIIILYFGIMIGVLSLSVPEILPLSVRMAAVWISVGMLIWSYLDEDNPYYELKWWSPKIFCNHGVYSWSGRSKEVTLGDTVYTVFYEGLNAGGIVEDGESVFICPSNMVSSVNKNRILKASLKLTETVDPVFTGLSGYKFVLFGSIEDASFGKVSLKVQEYLDQIELLEERNKQLEKANGHFTQLLSSRAMVNSLNNPELLKMMDDRLRSREED